MAYVNVRSGRDVLTDPNAGTFGELGSTAEDIGAALLPCAGSVLAGAQAVGDCIWNAIQGYIMARPDSEILLRAVQSMDCASALSAIGIGGSTASSICSAVSLATSGTAWPYVQRKASQMLGSIGAQTLQEMYDRGRDRSDAEGGGHTRVDESGSVVDVICPGYLVELKDAAGNPIGYVAEPPSVIGAGERCPSSATPPSTPPTQFYRPQVGAYRLSLGTVTGRVVDADGTPIFGAEIRVGSLRNPVNARTNASGEFNVTTTPATVTHVYVSAKGYAPVHVTVDLASGGTADAGMIVVGAAGGHGDQGDGLVVAKSWYKRTSTWLVVGGVVIVGGGIAVAVSRRRKGH